MFPTVGGRVSHQSNPQDARNYIPQCSSLWCEVHESRSDSQMQSSQAPPTHTHMCACLSQAPGMELSQHWTALVTMLVSLLLFLTAAVTYQQQPWPWGREGVCSLLHLERLQSSAQV